MGLLSFFSGLFKKGRAGDVAATTGSPAVASPPPPRRDGLDRAEANAFLHREEVLDSRNRLCGYRFSMMSGATGGSMPEKQFFEILRVAEIPAFAQRRMAFIPITPEGVAQGYHYTVAAPNTTMLLDIDKAALPVDAVVELLRAIRAFGCKTGLTGTALSLSEPRLLEMADVIFLKLSDFSLTELQNLARDLRSKAPALMLAAEGVQSWPERRMCAAWGFEYCLGGFLTEQDGEEPDSDIGSSRLVLIEMLNLLRSDAELSELGTLAKKDPGIAFHLLALANSAASGLASPVTSLDQAILVLGRERLYRWLTVSMFRIGSARSQDEALLEVALSRARFLETVAAANLPKRDCDELFLVGLFSLFDILLGAPMPQILSRMSLTESVVSVLLRSEGPYASYLMLALVMEHGRMAQAVELATALGIAPETLESASLAAFAWAQAALGHEGAD